MSLRERLDLYSTVAYSAAVCALAWGSSAAVAWAALIVWGAAEVTARTARGSR